MNKILLYQSIMILALLSFDNGLSSFVSALNAGNQQIAVQLTKIKYGIIFYDQPL